MTSFGSILLVLGVGALVIYMMQKGGGCCGGHKHPQQETKDKLPSCCSGKSKPE